MFENLFAWLRRSKKASVFVRHHRYDEKLDLTGQPLIRLSGVPVDRARELIPFLRPPEQMQRIAVEQNEILDQYGDPADEIHEFTGITHGRSRLQRLLVREGEVVQMDLKG